jgi:hypothetical protein
MNWTPAQVRQHQDLVSVLAHISSWQERAEKCFDEVAFSGKATAGHVREAERILGRRLPAGLRALHLEVGGVMVGGVPVVLPLHEIVRTNREMRTKRAFASLYMPFDHLLCFGEEGGGDLYAYPIVRNGAYARGALFRWDREADGRIWVASSMSDLWARLSTES